MTLAKSLTSRLRLEMEVSVPTVKLTVGWAAASLIRGWRISTSHHIGEYRIYRPNTTMSLLLYPQRSDTKSHRTIVD